MILTLAFIWDQFEDHDDPDHKNETVVSVAIVRKLSHFSGLPFEDAALELPDIIEEILTLLVV